MGIRTLEQLREKAPEELQGVSDAQLVVEFANDLGRDPQEIAEYFGMSTGRDKGDLAAGVSSGVDVVQMLGTSAVAGAADLVGADGIAESLRGSADRQGYESYLAGKPGLDRVEDLEGIGDYIDYAQYQIGKQVPIMGTVIGAQALPGLGQGAAAAGLTRLGTMAPRMLGGAGYKAGGTLAMRRAALAQGEALAKSTIVGSGLGYGSLYQSSAADGDPNPIGALALAPLYGLAEAAVPAALTGMARLKGGYAGGAAARFGKAGAVGSITEAGTEVSQTALELGIDGTVTAEQAKSQFLNAAVAGGLTGGSMSAAAAAILQKRIDAPSKINELGETDLTAPVVLPTDTRSDVGGDLFNQQVERASNANEQTENMEFAYGDGPVGDFANTLRSEIYDADTISSESRIALERNSRTVNDKLTKVYNRIKEIEDSLSEVATEASGSKQLPPGQRIVKENMLTKLEADRDSLEADAEAIDINLAKADFSEAANGKLSALRIAMGKIDTAEDGTKSLSQPLDEFESAVLKEADPALFGSVTNEAETAQESEIDLTNPNTEVVDELFDGVDITQPQAEQTAEQEALSNTIDEQLEDGLFTDADAKQMEMVYNTKKLEAAEASEKGEVTGQVTLPQGIISGLVRMIRSSDRVPNAIIYKDGTAQPDQEAMTEGGIAQMRDIHNKIMRVVQLAGIQENAGKNVVSKTKDGNRKISSKKKNELLQASRALPVAMQDLIDTVGGAKNLEAILGTMKVRNERSRSSTVDTSKYEQIGKFLNKNNLNNQQDLETTVDTLLSNAFTRFADGTLGDLDVVRGGETRKSNKARKTSRITPITQAVAEGGIRGLLLRVAGFQGAVSPYAKNLATQIRLVLEETSKGANNAANADVQVKFLEDEKGKVNPHYDPATNTIYIHKEASQEEILHETMHAATQFWVYQNPESELVSDLSTSLDEIFAFVGDGTTEQFNAVNMPPQYKENALRIVQLLQGVRSDKTDANANLNAVLELMAYGTTMRDFKNLLKAIKSDPSPGTAKWKQIIEGAWAKIVAVFQEFLGVKGTVANNVLDTSMAILDNARLDGRETSISGQGRALFMAENTDLGPTDVDGNPLNSDLFDTASNHKGVFDTISSQFMFAAAKWPEKAAAFDKHREATANYVRTNMPRLARHTSKIASHFQVPPRLRAIFKTFKEQRNTAYMNLERLAMYVESKDSESVVALIEHLDGDSTAIDKLQDMVHLKDVADSVRAAITAYVQELPSEIQAEFANKKFSEFLIYVEDESTISSHSMSMGAISTQIRKQGIPIEKSNQLDFHADFLQTDMNGDAILDGKFYSVKVSPVSGESYTVMVSKDVYDQKDGQLTDQAGSKLAVDPLKVEHTVFRYDGNGDVLRFKADMSYKEGVTGVKARKIANAMRNTMGGIASYYASKNFYRGMAILGKENGQVFDTIDEVNEVFGPRLGNAPGMTRPMTLDEANNSKLRGALRTRATFVQYPDSPDLYGDLSGKLVHGPTFIAMTDMSDRSPITSAEAYNASLRAFKKAKTIYNPGTHVTNVMSNVSLAIMHQIPVKTVLTAAKLMYKFENNSSDLTTEERAAMRAFLESGAMLGNYSSVEIKKALFQNIEKHIVPEGSESVMTRVTAFINMEADKGSLIGRLAKRGKRMDELATQLYAAEDNAFRLAAFLKNVGDAKANSADGVVTPDMLQKSGRYARNAFLDYDIDSQAVKTARQTFMPFISWTYAITPVLGRIAVTQPWAMANLLASYAMIDMAASALAGDDDELARMNGPEKLDERMFGIGPRMHIRLPFIGDEENPVYYRLGDYIPLASSTKALATENGFMGMDWWPQGLQPSSPALSAIIALIGGVDPYTGDPLHMVADSSLDKAATNAKFMYDVFTPPIIRSGNFEKISAAIDGDVNFAGQQVNVSKLLFAQVLGLKVVDYNIDQEMATRSFLDSQLTRDYQAAISKAKRDEMRSGDPDWKSLDLDIIGYEEELREELDKIYKLEE